MKSAYRLGRDVAAAAGLVLVLAGAHAAGGSMLISSRDPALAINAWGGARDGTALRLHNGCRPDNSDCGWSYRGGLLISDAAPGLAIKAVNVADGAALVLASGCQRTTPGCGWTYRDGMFISDGTSLAISAWGGARYGTTLRLSGSCRASNPDCTWSRPR